MNQKIYDALNSVIEMASYWAIDYRENNTWAEYTCNEDQIAENFKVVNDAKDALAELEKE